MSVSETFNTSTLVVSAVRIAADRVVVIPAYCVCCLPLKFSFSMITLPPADSKQLGNALIVPVGVGAVVPTPTLISNVFKDAFLIIKSP